MSDKNKRSNVAVFVPHNGCPHMCSFCDQRSITGQQYQPTPQDVKDAALTALKTMGEFSKDSEIAFFGGSFTAIDRDYMVSLLKAAYEFHDVFKGVRISTRPDCIDEEVLDLLKSYNVTAMELGAQSMDDEVLSANNRGHSAEQVQKASKLIKEKGFSLGLQMMTGLYKSTLEKDMETALKIAALQPDTVRIYPTVIMKNTALGDLYLGGEYKPYSFEDTVKLCSDMLKLFMERNIKVIRLGLHYSEELLRDRLAGAYHPAFREICESRCFLENIKAAFDGRENLDIRTLPDGKTFIKRKKVLINVAKGSVSKAVGQSGANKKYIFEKGYIPVFKEDENLKDFDVKIQILE